MKSLDGASFLCKIDFSILKDIGIAFVIPEDFVILSNLVRLFFDIVCNVPCENGVSTIFLTDYDYYQALLTSCSYFFDGGEIILRRNLEAYVLDKREGTLNNDIWPTNWIQFQVCVSFYKVIVYTQI